MAELLLGAAAVWTVIAAGAAGGSWGPPAAVLVAVALALALGRAGRRVRPSLVPAVLLVAAAVEAAAMAGRLSAGAHPAGFLRYPNASGALFVQGAVAAAMMVAMARTVSARLAGGGAMGMLIAAALVTSRAAGILALAVPVALLARPRPRTTATALAIVSAAALGGTLALAATADGAVAERLAPALTQRRIDVWGDAWTLMAGRPAVGTGPGGFSRASPTALRDADAAWAHNDFLQQGAESGVPALALLAAAVAWLWGRLVSAPAPGAVTALGAASLAAATVQGSVDYVLRFPVVPVAAAALVGTAVPGGGPAAAARRAVKTAVLPVGLLARRSPGDLVILLYHRVGAGDREIDLSAEAFDRQLAWLVANTRVRSLEDALASGGGGVVITFDDGFRDFHQHALPALVRHRVPAVLYLATGLVGDGDGARPDALTWEGLRDAVSTGLVTVGSHTHSHLDLRRASEEEAEEEMRRSKELVEGRLGVPCRHFGYPFCVGSRDADRVARRVFDSAALGWHTNRAGRIDRHRLGRLPVLRADSDPFFRAKVGGWLDAEAWVYRALRRGPWRPAP
jgi:peptidoglycan/xylan/chitin deacetylase (PgdA/CDA1 family)